MEEPLREKVRVRARDITDCSINYDELIYHTC